MARRYTVKVQGKEYKFHSLFIARKAARTVAMKYLVRADIYYDGGSVPIYTAASCLSIRNVGW